MILNSEKKNRINGRNFVFFRSPPQKSVYPICLSERAIVIIDDCTMCNRDYVSLFFFLFAQLLVRRWQRQDQYISMKNKSATYS